MQLEEVAKALKELGHPTRLFIFKHLVKAGEQGLPVGELQKQLAIPASTLSHHIAALVSVGLVKQNRESRTLLCVSQYAVLEEIIAFFRDECCVNSPEHRQDQRQELSS
ncbi:MULTISPECIES: ArsR/SmtB family transcription factor [Aeromonas]|uniref:ArsR/SmtB family transcription factor n=1 Tax=Aeromonas TaxID=642 RepID=UPI0005A77F17|nr:MULTISPECIES: metalloregulator ArsR/SmtB family transcription factor [Aeromonas]MBW3780090.1 helix-turn-helix transcriptional regulator [Aeromonas veronii]MCF5911204.1 helix-turn-helix domain-containing protein [Aeromonas veronii]MCO4171302.1 helix-turn-helix domain-containing protein [Aeromonas veronii]OKP41225.1 transcriptional regulator [Aeromonas veronii]QWZ77912.1 helix-turn-helix domain-containing protein [Aeromonas sp. FDAARGOS 1419]